MTEHLWKVVPLSKGQLLDVRPEDIVANGHFRLCDTYRGGGGYDQFPRIAELRFGTLHRRQFIVQLFGCNLDCPYCYVTREGVWGQPVEYSTTDLVAAYFDALATEPNPPSVFHLMGGAPALQLKFWPELVEAFQRETKHSVFHSDLMLTESEYDYSALRAVARPNCLYAVDIKGLTPEEHLKNTRKPFLEGRFWRNLDLLERAKVPYYITFTACSQANIDAFWELFLENYPFSYQERFSEAFSIDLINYDALPHVDDIPWGGPGGLSIRK